MVRPSEIPESTLVSFRQSGAMLSRASRFVDPHVVRRCMEVIDRRGEDWVRCVLGRDVSRRSIVDPRWPYLITGEERVIVAADAEEDRITVAALDPDTPRG